MNKRIVIGVVLMMGLLLVMSAPAIAQDPAPGGLVLWNKLGSDYEVLHSQVGENGKIIGTDYAYEPAMHGNGYVRKNTGSNFIQFPGSVLHNLNQRGTIELWITPKAQHPEPYKYGVFALVGHPVTGPTAPNNRGNVYLFWGDGVTGNGLYGAVRFDSAHAVTPSETTQFVATVGMPFHAAIVWDIDGIDGTADKVRVYRDGVVVGSTTASWNPNGTDLEEEFRLGTGPDAQGYDKFISDNIMVWNYAKTDFSGRFDEAPTITVPVDIKPGSDPNSINLKSKGVVPVAVLTTGDFDASMVDPSTVQFAGAFPLRWAMEDVAGDGDEDLLLHFKTQDLALNQNSTEATLTGETTGGMYVRGVDAVNIVPKGK